MSTVINPYAAPKAAVEDVSAHPEADAIRREHINHEASIRSIGTLYYLGAFFMIAGTLAAFLLESRSRTPLSAGPVVRWSSWRSSACWRPDSSCSGGDCGL